MLTYALVSPHARLPLTLDALGPDQGSPLNQNLCFSYFLLTDCSIRVVGFRSQFELHVRPGTHQCPLRAIAGTGHKCLHWCSFLGLVSRALPLLENLGVLRVDWRFFFCFFVVLFQY